MEKKKKILITGACGYIGYSLSIELRNAEYDVIGVDNGNRNEWVEQCGGKVYIPKDCHVIHGDLADKDFVYSLLDIHKPDVIIHLASQPSMPYSQINGERALYTQVNNISMCLNLLWGIHERGIKSRFITTTTTGIPGQHYSTIPEDNTLNMAGSWYHVSRGFDSVNCRIAAKQFGQEIIEFRTSIVYGLQTDLMKTLGLYSRFDTDFYFGTALNRFVQQAINGDPITVYGKGLQTKPFISLNDTVISLKNAITYKFDKKHTILNQVTESISIQELAELIEANTDSKIKYIDNPRKENETHQMHFENHKFLKVLNNPPDKIATKIGEMIDEIKNRLQSYTYI